MPRRTNTVRNRARASSFVREDERNRRRKRLAARKTHTNRSANAATYREVQGA